MIRFFALFLVCLSLGACASKVQKPAQELILKPSDPEKNLEIDEQFLNKSQRVGSTESGKPVIKTVLHP